MSVVSTVVCFLLATSMGGNSRPWSDPLVYGLLISSAVFGLVFCYIEAKVALNPLMPWHIISARTPLASSMVNFFGVMGSFAMTYTTPLFFQGVLGYSSSQAGLFFLPKVFAMSCGSLASGFWMARTGEYRKFITVSTLIALTSMICTSFWTRDTSFAFIIVCLLLDGFSSGAIITSALVAMLSCVGSSGKLFIGVILRSCSHRFWIRYGNYHFNLLLVPFCWWCDWYLCYICHLPRCCQTNFDWTHHWPWCWGGNCYTFAFTSRYWLTLLQIIDIARKSMTQVRALLPPQYLSIVLDTYEIAVRYSFYLCVGISAFCVLSSLFIQQFQLHTKVK